MRRLIRSLLLGTLLVLFSLFVGARALSEPLPEGVAGPEAEALADRIGAAIQAEAWARTGAIRWRMNKREHLWDRERSLARVRWEHEEALVVLGSAQGRAFRRGEELQGRAAARLVEKAYAAWVNDAFWLAAPTKLRDEGTTRSLVRTSDGDALLVQYSSGGLTPGDAYLWHPDAAGLPVAWSLWVSILPIQGVKITWEGWQALSTGAMVSTLHRVSGWEKLAFSLTDVAGAATLDALEPGPDPFAPLNP